MFSRFPLTCLQRLVLDEKNKQSKVCFEKMVLNINQNTPEYGHS